MPRRANPEEYKDEHDEEAYNRRRERHDAELAEFLRQREAELLRQENDENQIVRQQHEYNQILRQREQAEIDRENVDLRERNEYYRIRQQLLDEDEQRFHESVRLRQEAEMALLRQQEEAVASICNRLRQQLLDESVRLAEMALLEKEVAH